MKSISTLKKFLLSFIAILSICTSVFAAHEQAPVSDIDHTGYGNFSGNYVFSASDHVWFVFDAQAGDTIRFRLTTNFGSYAWIYRSNTGTVAVGDATTTIGGNGALTLKSQAGFFSPNSTNTVIYIVDSTGQFAIQLDHHTGAGTAGTYSVEFSSSGNPTPTATATPSTQTICSGATITPIAITGTVAGTVYNWTRDNAGVTGIATSGTGNISGSLTNATNAPITVTFTITPTANGITGAPITATVVVNPAPDVTQPANEVVCNGAPTAAVTFTGTLAGTVFNWTNSDPTIGLAASGTGNIASFNAVNTGTSPVVATVTVTPQVTSGSGGSVTQTFNYTGAVQTWTVPAGVTSVTIDATGAQGGNMNGGLGAQLVGTFTVTPGEVLAIAVGQQGSVNNCGGSGASGGGGGGSFIWRTSSPSLPMLVAGAGGGGNTNYTGACIAGINASITQNGTQGNGTLSALGGNSGNGGFGNAPSGTGSGGGGWLTAGQNSTFGLGCTGGAAAPVFTGGNGSTTYGPGGNGGFGGGGGAVCGCGGGGGYSGGGGGEGSSCRAGGGGGGSYNVGTSQVNTSGVQTGNGRVLITFGGGSSCSGPSRTFTYTVNPTPNAVATPASQTVCSANPITTIALTGAVSGTTYNWTRNNAGITGIAITGSGDIIGTLTNTTNAPVTVTFTITPTANGCAGAAVTATVVVNPTPDVTQPANQVVCNNTPAAGVSFAGSLAGTIFNWTNSDPTIGLAASGTGDIASFTATNAGTVPVVASVTVTPSTVESSIPELLYYKFEGSGASIPNLASAPPVGTTTATIVGGQTQGAPSICGVGSLIGTGTATDYVNTGWAPNLGNSSWTMSFKTSNITPSATLWYILGDINTSSWRCFTNGVAGPNNWILRGPVSEVLVTGGATIAPHTITFVYDNTLNNIKAYLDGVLNNTVTQPVLNITGAGPFKVGQYSTNSGLPSGGQMDEFKLFNRALTPLEITGLAPCVSGITCSGTPKTFTYTVNPIPTAVATPASQTVCSGATITAIAITGTVSGTVYNWTRDNAGVIGIATTGSGDISGTLTNATAAPVTVIFTITPSYTNAGATCTGTPITVTVVVNPTATVNAVANQVICNNGPTTAVTFSSPTTGGTIVYNWTNNTTSIGLAASGSGDIASFTATNTGSAPVIATITVTPSYTNGGVTCVGTPITYTYTVNPTAAINAVSNQVVCNGALTTAVNFSSPTTGGTIVYNWTNNTTSIGLAAGGSGDIASFTATNTGSAPVIATITVTPSYTNGGVTCVGTPITYAYTVNPTAAINAVSNQVVCNGSPTTAVTFTSPTTGGTIVYNWTNNTTSIGLAASGTGSIASFTATNTTTAPVTATITVTPSYTNAGVTCVGTPITYTYTVNPTATVNAVANQVICNNGSTTAVTFTSPTTGGTIVYNWTNNTTSIGLAASGTGSIASFTAVNTGTAPVIATITVTPSYNNGGVTCLGTPITYTYTVNPTSTVTLVTNQVICNGSPTTAVTFTSPTTGGTIVYNWTNNTTSIGLAASGTGNIASFTATNTTTAPVTATITVTPSYTNGGVTCVGTPITYTYTVNPTATVNAVANQVICNNGSTTAVTFTSPTTGGTIVYNWTNNTASIGLAASGTGNIAGFTATNTTTAPVTATITVTPSYTNGGVNCVGTPSTYTYTVNPTATVTPVTSQVICNGSPTTAVTFSSPTTGGTIVYNWTNNTASIGLAASGTGNIASFTATNTTTAPVVATITVTPSYTNAGVTCVGTAITYTYTVNPTATVNVVTNQVVCNLSPTTAVTFTSPTTGGTIVYNWTNTTTSIGLAASGTGNIASFTATNTTTAPVTATITVTPSYTNAGVTCVGTPRTFTITVNPTATVNPVANQVLCNNFPTTAVTFSSPTTGGTIVYNWTNNTTSIGLAASGTGNIASFTATNTTQVPVVATITVTPSYTNAGVTCVGTANTYTYTVNPTPIVTLAPFAAICKNAAPITLTGGSPVAGAGATGVYLVDNVAQTIFNPANYTPGLHTIVYVYTNVFGCVNSATQTILVHPIHTVEITVAPNRPVSPNNPLTVVATVSPVDNYTYIWRKNGTVVSGANGDRITVLANDAGNYTVTVTAPTGCVVVSSSAFTPSASVPQTLFIFPNPSTGVFNVAYNNGGANLTARTLTVYDGKGARVFSQSYSVNVPFGNMKVDISKYAKGLYYVVLNDSNGKKLASAAVEKL